MRKEEKETRKNLRGKISGEGGKKRFEGEKERKRKRVENNQTYYE